MALISQQLTALFFTTEPTTHKGDDGNKTYRIFQNVRGSQNTLRKAIFDRKSRALEFVIYMY